MVVEGQAVYKESSPADEGQSFQGFALTEGLVGGNRFSPPWVSAAWQDLFKLFKGS